jgi:type VI protein secretion system component VasK
VLVALAMIGSPLPVRRWLSLLGMVSAAGIFIGTLEPAGFEPAANIVVVSYILWSIWLALFGIFLLLPRTGRRYAPQSCKERRAHERDEGQDEQHPDGELRQRSHSRRSLRSLLAQHPTCQA